jgi:hypothetical protein
MVQPPAFNDLTNGGVVPPVLSRVKMDPPEDVSVQPGLLLFGVNARLPIVRDESRVTVMPLTARLGKVAVKPAPSAIVVLVHLVLSLQLPLPALLSHVPL